jgi:dipeptidyl aminopeptidase/acylaminoacyl peptidase
VISVFSVVKKGLVALALLALVGPGAAAQTALTGEIAYVQEGNIWVRDLATGQARQLTTDGQSILPAWTPDGQSLIFVSGRDGNSELYRMRPDGMNVTRVTNNPQTDTLPAVSRDGTLYFIRLNVGTDGPPPGQEPTAALIRSDFTTETEVYTQSAGLCLPVDLQVYDADHIALTTSCGRGKNVLLVNLQTRAAPDVTQVAPGGEGCAADGVWAHNTPQLATIMQRNCDPNQGTTLRIVDFGPTPPPAREVFSAPGIGSVAWSPDDTLLMYSRYNEDNSPAGVWVVPAAGGTPQPVTDQGITPAWRPGLAAPAPTATSGNPPPAPTNTGVPTAPATPAPAATGTSAPPAATGTPAPPAATATAIPIPPTPMPVPGGAGPCGAIVLIGLLALAFLWTRAGFHSRG